MTLECGSILLRSGAQMPRLGLGTYQMRADECRAAVCEALRQGYRMIDTAAVYKNEEAVAEGIAASGVPRSEVFITSKLQPSDHGERAYEAALASMKRLGVDYLDLFLVHWPGIAGMQPGDPRSRELRKTTWLALQRLSEEGRCRSIGVSNYTPFHLEELCTAPWCTVVPAVNQFELHPLLPQADIVAACQRYGIVVEAYSSLARGARELLEAAPVVSAAASRGATPPQVALLWAAQKGYVVIPKSTQPERIRENAGYLRLPALTLAEMAAIDALSSESEKRCCWNPYTITA